jgi:hypothetical protein
MSSVRSRPVVDRWTDRGGDLPQVEHQRIRDRCADPHPYIQGKESGAQAAEGGGEAHRAQAAAVSGMIFRTTPAAISTRP